MEIRVRIQWVVAMTAILLAGCAGTAPKAAYNQKIEVNQRIASQDVASVTVEAPPDVKVLDSERARLAEKIDQKIKDHKAANAREGDARNYAVELKLTRYEKGSAFARSMLAGLGQIHIDGDVSVFALPDRQKVGDFHLKKTFAWGGIYGGATSIEDIEGTFADGVAAAVTGQEEAKDSGKAKKK